MYGSGGICRSASLMGSRKSLPPKHVIILPYYLNCFLYILQNRFILLHHICYVLMFHAWTMSQTVLGNQVPLGEICLFAHHCEAAEGMEKQKKEDWTICHVCSFEGVHDRLVMIKDVSVKFQWRKFLLAMGDAWTYRCNFRVKTQLYYLLTFVFDFHL